MGETVGLIFFKPINFFPLRIHNKALVCFKRFLITLDPELLLRGVLGHTLGPLPWAHCDEALVDGVAKLVGAKPVEVVLMNSLTVNLHCLLVRKPLFTNFMHTVVNSAFCPVCFVHLGTSLNQVQEQGAREKSFRRRKNKKN